MSKKWYEYLFEALVEAFMKPKGADISGAVVVPISGTGYTTPQPPQGVAESRDLEHLEPGFRRDYLILKAEFQRRTGRQLFETCTYRSCARQHELYQIGRRGVPGERIVTKLDGLTKKGRHNVYPSEAVDVCVDIDPGPGKHVTWDPEAYELLGALALEYGLKWGGDWNRDGSSTDEKFVDYPHLERV